MTPRPLANNLRQPPPVLLVLFTAAAASESLPSIRKEIMSRSKSIVSAETPSDLEVTNVTGRQGRFTAPHHTEVNATARFRRSTALRPQAPQQAPDGAPDSLPDRLAALLASTADRFTGPVRYRKRAWALHCMLGGIRVRVVIDDPVAQYQSLTLRARGPRDLLRRLFEAPNSSHRTSPSLSHRTAPSLSHRTSPSVALNTLAGTLHRGLADQSDVADVVWTLDGLADSQAATHPDSLQWPPAQNPFLVSRAPNSALLRGQDG
jgi:hypothetical protein